MFNAEDIQSAVLAGFEGARRNILRSGSSLPLASLDLRPGTATLIDGAPNHLQSEIDLIMNSSLADSTHRSYQKAWGLFAQFSKEEFKYEKLLDISATRMKDGVVHSFVVQTGKSILYHTSSCFCCG